MFNRIKTFILLGLMSALLLFIGSLFGERGLLVGLIIALAINIVSYWHSDKIILKMYKAEEIRTGKIKDMVKEAALKANIPAPKTYISEMNFPNAFATGRNPKNSVICVTDKLVDKLNNEELKGVIAHEISHIKNRDTLISTVASVIAMTITYMAFFLRWGAIFSSGKRASKGLGYIIAAIFIPLTATIIRMAISRSREYLADKGSYEITNNPEGLISALNKINESQKISATKSQHVTSNMFIINPFQKEKMLSLFSTHPNTEERIKKLKEYKN